MVEEDALEGSYLVVTCILKDSIFQLSTYTLVYCDATGLAFIVEDFDTITISRSTV